MKQGVEEGRTPPRVLMERLPRQIEAQISEKPEDSAFYAPFRQLPADIADDTRAWLRERARTAIRAVVVPAYRRLLKYFNESYLPASRGSIFRVCASGRQGVLRLVRAVFHDDSAHA